MSTQGSRASAGGVRREWPKRYYCHACNATVPVPNPEQIYCPVCNGGFIEEVVVNPEHELPQYQSIFSNDTGYAAYQQSSLPFLLNAFLDLRSAAASPAPPPAPAPSPSPTPVINSSSPAAADPRAFDPYAFLQNYIQTFTAGGGNFQLIFEDANQGLPSFRLGGGNFGDYYMGGLEQLIEQLAENDPNRYGTPPAAKSAVSTLPDVTVSKEMMSDDVDGAQCAVCKDAFALGDVAKQMPCKHIYHPDCILPWLELHNSCPVCRFELPTDDEDYEGRKKGGNDRNGEDGAGSSGNSAEERRFNMGSWMFRNSQDGGSQGGSGNGN